MGFLKSLLCKHEYREPSVLRAPHRDALIFECSHCGTALLVLLKERWAGR